MAENKVEKSHQWQCKVCQHEQLKEIEEEYLSGATQAELIRQFSGLDKNCVSRHIQYYELDKRRDNSTLAIINRIVQGIDWAKLKVETVRNALTVLDLRAKLLGEIVQKHEYKEILDELTTEQLQELAGRSTGLIDARLAQAEDQSNREVTLPS